MVVKSSRETQLHLPGMSNLKGDYKRVPSAARGAREYSRAQGLPYSNRNIASVRADPNTTVAIGAAVRDQQGPPAHISPQMHQSYAALAEHIGKQYDYMTGPKESGGMGISVEVTPEDPYRSMREARADVASHGRLKVLATETTSAGHQGRHPALSRETNDKFRAIHDMFGHLAVGRDTSRHGEEAAVQHHAQMFPKAAHPALMSELRGQNSALIYTGNFPQDKPYDLPSWSNEIKAKAPEPPKRKPEGKQGTLLTRNNKPRKNV